MKKTLIFFIALVCLLFMAAAHPPPPFHNDSLWRVYDNGDVTKRVAFEVSGISTGTTRTITMPDSDVDLGAPIFDDITTTGDLILNSGDEADIYFRDGATPKAAIGIGGSENLTIISESGTVYFGNDTVQTAGDMKCHEFTLSETTQDYLFTDLDFTTTALALQSQTTNTDFSLNFYPLDGDGADAVQIRFWAKSTPASYTNYESLQIGYTLSGTKFMIYSAQHGTGEGAGIVRPIHIYTKGNDNQFVAEADGDILMATIPGLSGKTAMVIDTVSKQIGYDSSSLVYKENIRDIADVNSCRIYDLRPVIYDCKDDSGKDIYGLVAEEVNEVMPEIVRYRVDPIRKTRKDEFGEDEEYIAEWKQTNIPDGVEYSRLWAPILKEMQKLRAEVDELQTRMVELEKRK